MKNTTYIVIVVLILIIAIPTIFFPISTNTAKNQSGATVAVTAVRKDLSTASAIDAGALVINWKSESYPASTGVDIHLIKKISDSPIAYEFVTDIEKNTSNDGSTSWNPTSTSAGDYIEVTCTSAQTFEKGCTVSSSPIQVN